MSSADRAGVGGANVISSSVRKNNRLQNSKGRSMARVMGNATMRQGFDELEGAEPHSKVSQACCQGVPTPHQTHIYA